jgi:hypothetical protein
VFVATELSAMSTSLPLSSRWRPRNGHRVRSVRGHKQTPLVVPNIPSGLHEPPCRDTDEYNDPEHEAINHERPSRELL